MSKRIRVTLDLSPHLYERLEKLVRLLDAGTKANVLRQAIQIYEFLAYKSLDGCVYQSVDSNGVEERLVFIGPCLPPPPKRG